MRRQKVREAWIEYLHAQATRSYFHAWKCPTSTVLVIVDKIIDLFCGKKCG